MLSVAWVVCEQRDGRATPTSLEVATAAARLAESVEAFSWGPQAAEVAAELGRHGVGRLYDLGDLGDALAGRRVAAAMAERARSNGLPSAILAATSYDGRDIAARLSVMIDRPVLANVVDLKEVDGGLETAHEILGGTEVARARVSDREAGILLVRAKSFVPEEKANQPADVEPLPPPPIEPADGARVVERHVEESTGPRLDEAAVIVSGGRGLGGAEHYQLIEELARLLGGAPAASRAIVDAGWVPYAYQVGQTGKTVKPDVYLAFGISGAMQHLVGMKGAKHIVAVNKDAAAPLLQIADLGIVADVHQVLPALIEAVRKAKA